MSSSQAYSGVHFLSERSPAIDVLWKFVKCFTRFTWFFALFALSFCCPKNSSPSLSSFPVFEVRWGELLGVSTCLAQGRQQSGQPTADVPLSTGLSPGLEPLEPLEPFPKARHPAGLNPNKGPALELFMCPKLSQFNSQNTNYKTEQT